MERAGRAVRRDDPEVITISEFAKGELVRDLKLDPSRVHVTPLAADPVFAVPQSTEALEAAQRRWKVMKPYVISLGTVEPRKNLAALAEAGAMAGSAVSRLTVAHLGRKGYRHESVLAEAAPATRGAFRWLGSVPDADAAALVQGASALVFPSVYEGFGLPAVEGMAAGVPVIASDIPVMREICGDAARLVDTTRPSPLAEAI